MSDATSNCLRDPSPDNDYDWPYNQSYLSGCLVCGCFFAGPKRASKCWVHLPQEEKHGWIMIRDG